MNTNINQLLDNTICSGLDIPINEQTTKFLEAIPDNVFGVFVTIKRSQYQKLSRWPEDIHGCIGYWDHNYKILSKHLPFLVFQ